MYYIIYILLQCFKLTGPPSYVRCVVDRIVVMRRIPVFRFSISGSRVGLFNWLARRGS